MSSKTPARRVKKGERGIITMSAPIGARELPASAQLMQMITGKWIARSISAAADLGVADQLVGGPRSIAEIAEAVGAHEPSLYRLLRALASVGIFEEIAPRQFGLTPLAEALRSDSPDSIRNFARFVGMPMTWDAWRPFTETVRTGKTGVGLNGIENPFDYLQEHPDQAALFNAAMTDFSRLAGPAVAEAYDFGGIHKLVDVGGGHGFLLAAVLARYPGLTGVLFDLPKVIDGARANGLPERCETASGSFFDSVPGGADAYMMKHIIHDWDEERATLILRNCRSAIAPNGKLLVIEMVVPAGNDPSLVKLLDLEMLAIPGGRERTEAEYRDLYASTGFELTKIVPTKSPVCVIEGRPF